MKKTKKSKKNKKPHFSNSKLFELLVSIFRKNPNKRFNYKQLSKILQIKDKGIKIQMIEVMKKMEEKKILEEIQKGSYRITKKRTKIIVTIKSTNNKGAYAKIDNDHEVFIAKEYSHFVLAGDEAEVLLLQKRKRKQDTTKVV